MKEKKNYEVTFAKGSPQEVTYPVQAASKKEATEEFSRQYIGRNDQTLARLVKVAEVKDESE